MAACVIVVVVILWLIPTFIGDMKNWDRQQKSPDYMCDTPAMAPLPSNISTPDTCQPRSNIFYMRVHKTGSTTLLGVLFRHALWNKLRLPKYRPLKTLSGREITKNIIPKFEPGVSERYNIMGEHCFYDTHEVDDILNRPYVRYTMIRDPLTLTPSWFEFYQVKDKLGTDFETFINNPRKYETVQPWLTAYRNRITKQFRIPTNLDPRSTEFKCRLQNITRMFTVLLMEEYEMSLVLLRRLLCWPSKDILYVGQHRSRQSVLEPQKERQGRTKPNGNISKQICKWHNLDCVLYKYFKAAFWDQVTAQDPDFPDEVQTFMSVQRAVYDYCQEILTQLQHSSALFVKLYSTQSPLHIPATRWSKGFNVSVLDCASYKVDPAISRDILYLQQHRRLCQGDMVSCRVHHRINCEDLCRGVHNTERALAYLAQFPTTYVW